MDEELPIKPKRVHEIGQDLYLLSVEELRARVGTLKEEIVRLEAAIEKTQASRNAADAFFKR